jgi:RNA polymerase sigma factor (sigma-70 family)
VGPRTDDADAPRLGPSSFAALYERHQRGLLAYFMRRTFDAEAAVDLVGETFAQAFVGRRRFRGATAEQEAAFLYGVARRLLSRYLRRGRAERAALERLGVARPHLDDESLARIEELAGVATMRALVGEHLRALSEEQRRALRLRVVEELPYSEVAARMGVTEQVARARVSRALRGLDRRLSRAAGEAGLA